MQQRDAHATFDASQGQPVEQSNKQWPYAPCPRLTHGKHSDVANACHQRMVTRCNEDLPLNKIKAGRVRDPLSQFVEEKGLGDTRRNQAVFHGDGIENHVVLHTPVSPSLSYFQRVLFLVESVFSHHHGPAPCIACIDLHCHKRQDSVTNLDLQTTRQGGGGANYVIEKGNPIRTARSVAATGTPGISS